MSVKEIILSPEEAFDESRFTTSVYQKLGIKQDGDQWVRPIKRSIDARGKKIVVRVQCEVFPASEKKPLFNDFRNYPEG